MKTKNKHAKATPFSSIKTKLKLQGAQIREYLIGKTIIPIKNTNGHDYTIGQAYVLDEQVIFGGTYLSGIMNPVNGYGGNSINFTDFIVMENNKEAIERRREELTSSIETFQREIAVTEEKLKYLTETKTEELDEEAFKGFMIEKILGTKDTIKEKTARIMELIS